MVWPQRCDQSVSLSSFVPQSHPLWPLALGKESLADAWVEGPGGEASAMLVVIWGLPGYAHGAVT